MMLFWFCALSRAGSFQVVPWWSSAAAHRCFFFLYPNNPFPVFFSESIPGYIFCHFFFFFLPPTRHPASDWALHPCYVSWINHSPDLPPELIFPLGFIGLGFLGSSVNFFGKEPEVLRNLP